MRRVFLLVFLCLFSGCALESAIKGIPWLGDIYRLPDIDQRFTDIPGVNLFICHRSILTHNAVLPLAVAWISRPFKTWGAVFPLVVGSLFAFHFLLDLFPKKWYGYAFIHIPVLGWLDWIPYDSDWVPTIFSIFWLALNAIVSQGAFLYTLKPEMRINPFSR